MRSTVVPGISEAAMIAFSVTVSPRSVSTIGRSGAWAFEVHWYAPSVATTSRPKWRSNCMWGSTVRAPRSQPPAYGSWNSL